MLKNGAHGGRHNDRHHRAAILRFRSDSVSIRQIHQSGLVVAARPLTERIVSIMYELKPIDGRKSFYGKAKVWAGGPNDEWLVLKSYSTNVCAYNTKTHAFIRTWDDYSATTMRHVNAFICTCKEGVKLYGVGKNEWLALPVVNKPWL